VLNSLDRETIGNSISHIHRYKVDIGELVWSIDNLLAFTEFYTFIYPYDGDPSEIFVWDETSITSVSQNPLGEDRQPDWSLDGRLAFLSNRDGKKYEIFVWDGISKNKGIPIIELQRNDAEVIYYSSPTWTNSGALTVCATGPEDQHHYAQIYEWSGQTITNISKKPKLHSCSQTWRSDGYWSFATFFSSPLLFIRDNENKTQLTVEGAYAPAWSQSGLLMFCNYTSVPGEWKLSMWDGKEIVEIVQSNHIIAVWSNGSRVYCSNG